MTCNHVTRCTYSQCMPYAHLNGLWTDRQHLCITVSRHGMCFWVWMQTVQQSMRAVVRYLETVCSKSYGRKHTAVKKCSEIASEAILAKNILVEVNFESCYISRLWGSGSQIASVRSFLYWRCLRACSCSNYIFLQRDCFLPTYMFLLSIATESVSIATLLLGKLMSTDMANLLWTSC